MAKGNTAPRYALAKNLNSLLAQSDMSGPDLAIKARVDRKTVNNYRRGRSDPQPDKVEALAAVFGVTASDLYNPDFDFQAASNLKLKELLSLYGRIDEPGRQLILGMAAQLAKRE